MHWLPGKVYAQCLIEWILTRHHLNEDKTEGGRIDLFLTDENRNHIIIENKIYAGDQENQILRYYNHSQSADLFYLTLEGDEPFEYSKKELERDIHFKCLSYKKDIIE